MRVLVRMTSKQEVIRDWRDLEDKWLPRCVELSMISFKADAMRMNIGAGNRMVTKSRPLCGVKLLKNGRAEPATSRVTGRRSNQPNYAPVCEERQSLLCVPSGSKGPIPPMLGRASQPQSFQLSSCWSLW